MEIEPLRKDSESETRKDIQNEGTDSDTSSVVWDTGDSGTIAVDSNSDDSTDTGENILDSWIVDTSSDDASDTGTATTDSDTADTGTAASDSETAALDSDTADTAAVDTTDTVIADTTDTETAVSDTETGTDNETGSDTATDSDTEMGSDTATGADTETGTDIATGTDTATDSDTEMGTETGTDTETGGTQMVDCADITPPVNGHQVESSVEITWDGSSWSAPASCAWECDSGYHTEDATACVSDTQTVDCADITPPVNGHQVESSVEITWDGSSWSAPASCAWECDSGYHTEDNVTCVADTHDITVTTVSDVADGDTATIDALKLNSGADGEVSLREALLACNATVNDVTPDLILFDIADAAPYTISVTGSALPDITDPVVIDGRSEPDFVSEPIIALDGSALFGTESGLSFVAGSDGSTVRALVVINFPDSGVLMTNSDNHTVQGMYSGVGLDGATRQGNSGSGLTLLDSGSNQIGGSINATPVERNVFSGNAMHGVILDGSGSNYNIFSGNMVGLDATGNETAHNIRNGIVLINGAHHNTVGSSIVEYRNVISGNQQAGVRIVGSGTDDNVIQGNFIGTDIANSGVDTLGNGWAGVRIYQYAQYNLIGGDDPSLGNWIRYNSYDGVSISGGAPTNNPVIGNSIADNGLLGIDLGIDNTVTPNDAGDLDNGDNDLLNFPELTGTSYAFGEITVNYDLDVPAGEYRIEFFENLAADDSAYGEGFMWAHAETVSHGGTGKESFSATFAATETNYITATATEILGVGQYGSTSEFSLAAPTTWTSAACVRYVDINAGAVTETGLSWAEAFSDIQSGVDAASTESPACEVWVAAGNYVLFGGVNDSITLQPDVSLYGGFGGLDVGETTKDERDSSWAVNPTIISGNNTAYHVITGAANTRLDGFVITSGNANGGGIDEFGGGLFVTSAPMTVANCRFVGNYAGNAGGGIYANGITLKISDSDFTDNFAGDGVSLGSGGAISVISSAVQVADTTFNSNGDMGNTFYGSAVYFSSTSSFITGTEFNNNESISYGTIYADAGTHTWLNMKFAGNAANFGGATIAATGATITTTNMVSTGTGTTEAAIDLVGTTFTMVNSSVYDTGQCYLDNGTVPATIVNSILWTTGSTTLRHDGVAPNISYSIVKGGAAGTSVSSSDPRFVSAPDDLTLLSDSPAIDAGNGDEAPSSDYAGTLRYDATTADSGTGTPTYTDIGAYEYWP
ncbi:MAG: hypothetical protein JXX14_25125 [Deltaproteobacteria bacterium]|nr:hypothetical protein [Deltaproteobacteria bacterium]